MATTTLSPSDEHPKRRSQLRSSITSAPSVTAAPESFATHVTSSSVKSRGTVSGTSPYSSKAVYMVFSTVGTHISGCFSRRTSATVHPVLVHWSSGTKHPPPSLSVSQRPAYWDYPIAQCRDNSLIPPHPPPLLRCRPCPPWQPPLPWYPLTCLCGDPSPRGPSAWLYSPISPQTFMHPASL